MTFPQPGQGVRGSRTGRPVMVLLDLLGRRMALRILWELHTHNQPLTFRQLEAAAETNPGVLNTRLRELRDAHVLHHDGCGYSLTDQGRTLIALLVPIHDWAETWAARSEWT